MNLPIQQYTIALLAVAAVLMPQRQIRGQDSKVNFREEPRITGGLLTRSELTRLIDSKSNDNPLRRPDETNTAPSQVIRDPSVSPAAWQDGSESRDSGFLVKQKTETASSASVVPEVDEITTPNLPVKANPAPEPSVQATPAPEAATTDETPSPGVYGPMPWDALINSWRMRNDVTADSVEDLEIEVNRAQQEVESSSGIDENADEERLKQLKLAREAVNDAKQRLEEKAEYVKKIAEFPQSIELLRRKAKAAVEPRRVDNALPVDEMQARLDQLQSELAHGNTQLLKTQDQMQNRDTRLDLIPAEILAARDKANDLHNQILQKQAEGAGKSIEVLVMRADELAANSEVQLREEERKWHELSYEALPLEKTLYHRAVQRLETEISQWNHAIDKRRQHELDEQVRIAKQKAIDAHPSLKELLDRTTGVAKSRKELAAKISALEDEELKVNKQLSTVDKQHQNLEQSLANLGKDDSRSELVEVHRNLIRPYEGMARVQSLKHELQQSKASIRLLRNEQEQVSDPATFIRDSLEIGEGEVVHSGGTSLFAMAEEAVDLHRDQLNKYNKDAETYRGLLKKLLASRQSLQEKISATRELVDTNMLWVQSSDPVSVEWLHDSRDGAEEFFDPGEWALLGDSVASRVKKRPYESAIGIFGLIVAFAVGRKFRG